MNGRGIKLRNSPAGRRCSRGLMVGERFKKENGDYRAICMAANIVEASACNGEPTASRLSACATWFHLKKHRPENSRSPACLVHCLP
jgi:hypothetical protein